MAKGKKTGGRVKGTPNKTTAEMREMLKALITAEMQSLPALLSEMKPSDRVNAIIRIMAYIMPKPPESYDISWADISSQINIKPIEWVSTPDPEKDIPSTDRSEIGA